MRIFLMYRARIKYLAAMDGVTAEDKDRLARIAERSLIGCSFDDAVRIAWIVFKGVRAPPERVH
jgi:hypothetical protein